MTEYRAEPVPAPAVETKRGGHGGHSWMMIACCIPMLAIAVALVASGVASPGLLLGAGACALLMAFMMRGMDHGAGGAHDGHAHAGHEPGEHP